MVPVPTFPFVGGPCCPSLDIWIMITFDTLLTSQHYISKKSHINSILLLTRNPMISLLILVLQGYNESRLKSPFRKFYGRYNDLVCNYKLSLAHMLNDLFHTIC
jgi:ABC-type maltose transport system permease subunit